MVLSEIRSRVYYRVGRGGDTTLNTDILYALNTIQREINLSLNLEELRKVGTITTVISTTTQSYNLADDFLKMVMIWEDNTYDHELLRIRPEEYKYYEDDIDTTTGTLTYYDIYDTADNSGVQVKKISFIPIPSAVATVPYHYYKKLAALTADSDENILMELYPDLYIEGAAYILCRDNLYIDNPERIAFRRGEYEKQIEIVRRAQRQTDRIPKVAPKRILPTSGKLYSTQFSGYTS
jgi:hypothetical protein